MNIIGGTPRSGSTLLQNILNQNPKYHVSSTSPLPGFLVSASQLWSGSVELKSEQHRDKAAAEERRKRFFRGMCETFYYDEERTVFDKSRGWNDKILMYQHLFPDGKAVMCVRNLPDVLASIEKQHRKDPTVDVMSNMNLVERAQTLFSPKGMIGNVLRGIQDILVRKLDVHFIQAEQLAENPEFVINKLYCYLLESEPFKHDYENVENTSTDPDYIYWDKYPHNGSGAVVKLESEWPKVMTEGLAKSVHDAFPWYNKRFGY